MALDVSWKYPMCSFQNSLHLPQAQSSVVVLFAWVVSRARRI